MFVVLIAQITGGSRCQINEEAVWGWHFDQLIMFVSFDCERTFKG